LPKIDLRLLDLRNWRHSGSVVLHRQSATRRSAMNVRPHRAFQLGRLFEPEFERQA
jgi:hypothetical protein